MMRFAWVTMASAVLLAGCGGGLSSPDFKGDLVGFDIVYPNSTSQTAQARTAPGTTFQFSAIGLYSLPPGTSATTPNTRPCPSTSDPSRVCRQGEISGVTWSVDPTGTVNGQPLATINGDGLATALRRGYAQVRARAAGFPDVTEQLIVNGPVVQGINMTVANAKYGTTFPSSPTPSVPTGRSFALTGTATCDRGFSGGEATGDGPVSASTSNCVNGANASYQFSWSLGDTTNPNAAEFSPASGIAKSILAKTKLFGPLEVVARITNEEGQVVQQSVALDAGIRVLDDIVVSADPAQAQPVPVVIGTKTRFIARGLFSDGNIDDIRSSDLKAALVWSKDASAVGDIQIENATGTSPNAAVLVSGVTVGVTGLTAKSTNTETNVPNKPDGLELEDRVTIDVKTFGLLRLVDVCPFDSVGAECRQNIQLPLNTTTKFKVRGNFQDSPNTPRDIDPTKIPVTWSKTVTPASGDVTVLSSGGVTSGEFTATKTGPVTINVGITDPMVEQAANPRTISTTVTVVEPVCRDQLLAGNGSVATGSSSNVTNTGNVTDSNQDNFALIRITPTTDTEELTVQRAATTVTPGATGIQVGFLITSDPEFNAGASSEIETLNASGAVVQTLTVSATELSTLPMRDGKTVIAAKANATQPFTGIRFVAEAPPFSTGSPLDALLVPLATLLSLGGSADVQVYAACADFIP